MATIEKYINSSTGNDATGDGSSGAPYLTQDGFDTAEAGNKTQADLWIVHIAGSAVDNGGSVDFTEANFPTQSGGELEFRGPKYGDNGGTGQKYDTSVNRLEASSGITWQTSCAYPKVLGIQVKQDANTESMRWDSTTTGVGTFEQNFIWHTGSSDGFGCRGSGNVTCYFGNNAVRNEGGSGTADEGIQCNNANATMYAYRCALHMTNSMEGYAGTAGTMHVKNCLAETLVDNGNSFSSLDSTAYCAASPDETLSGTGDRTNQTIVLVAPTSTTEPDLGLDATDASCIDFGTDLSADANYALSTDINGKDISGITNFDIGAHEVEDAGVVVGVPAASLGLTGFAPTVSVSSNQTVNVPVASLTATGQIPAIQTPVTVDIPTGSLSATGQAPTASVSDNQSVDVPAGSLAATGQAPTIAVSDNQSVDIPAGSLGLAGLAPTPTTTNNITINVPAAALTLTGFVPTITASDHQVIGVPTASLNLTGFVPTIATDGSVTISVPVGSLGLTGFLPTIQNPVSVDVPVASLNLTGLVPTAQTTVSVDIPAGTLALTGLTPTPATSDNQSVSVPSGSLGLAGQAPTVSATANVSVDVPTASLTLMGYAPTLSGIELWTDVTNTGVTWSATSDNAKTWTPTTDTPTTWN